MPKINFQEDNKIDFQPVDFQEEDISSGKQGLFGRINESLIKRGVNIADELNAPSSEGFGQSLSKLPRRALRVTGQAAGFIGDVGSEALTSAYTNLVPEKAQTAISGAATSTFTDPLYKPFIQGVSSAIEKGKAKDPEGFKDISAMTNIASLGLGSKPVQKLSISARESAISGTKKATAFLAKSTETLDKELKATVKKGIEKSIRPGVDGKRTFGQTEKYYKNAQNAVENIVQNKNNLKLTNESGEIVEGLPTNLKQFSQSVEQTKREIFKEYDSMAKGAGEAGAKIDTKTAIPELNTIVDNKALQDFSPQTVAYAKSRIESIKKAGVYTAQEAQDSIAIMNHSLEAFYKNPSYDTASKAYVDAILANHMRKGLDVSIEKLQGPGYQKLKSAYGSLKTIEKDINRRAIVDARGNTKGLIDFSDVFSGSAAVHGILTLNPAIVGEAAAAKGIAILYKHLNDPNRVVKNMFEKTEKIMSKKMVLSNRPLVDVIKGVEKNVKKESVLKAEKKDIDENLGTVAPLAIKTSLSDENNWR